MRVLVVEDEEPVRELTGRILSENGYRVIGAADGYRARILCDQFQGEIDLLLSDVVMPGMSGRELAEHSGGHEVSAEDHDDVGRRSPQSGA